MANSILNVSKKTRQFISSNKIDKALKLISKIVENVTDTPVCTAQIFGSKTLDKLCLEIGAKTLESLSTSNIDKPQETTEKKITFIYIASRIQNSGGHTKVIESFIKLRPTAKHVVLLTGLFGRSSIDYFLSCFSSVHDVSVEASPSKNWTKTLLWLQQKLLMLKAEKYYLFNHHQDSVSIAAAQPQLGSGVFYHHGDHHLCLGVYLSHLEHVDIHPMGFHLCREELQINNTYLPLSTEDLLMTRSEKKLFKPAGYLTTCTAARFNKLEQPYIFNYINLIPELLKVTKGKHVHIGTLTPWSRLKLYLILKKNRIPTDSFVYIPWVQSVWKTLIDQKIDLYIASFPFGGGLTLIEAMGSATPVVIHKHIFSRLLGGYDMVPKDVLAWRYPQDLMDYVANLDSNQLKKLSKSVREHYLQYYQKSIAESILIGHTKNCALPPKNNIPFDISQEDWALWVVEQNKFKHKFPRFLLRLLKKIKRSFP